MALHNSLMSPSFLKDIKGRARLGVQVLIHGTLSDVCVYCICGNLTYRLILNLQCIRNVLYKLNIKYILYNLAMFTKTGHHYALSREE